MTAQLHDDTSISTLVRFLLARIDEDEVELARAHRAQAISRSAHPYGAAMQDIVRLQAECTAKRAVIGQAQLLLVLRDLPMERSVREAATALLRSLAEPYRDHRAFCSDWRRTRRVPQ